MGKATTFKLPFFKKENVAKDTYAFYFKRNGEFDEFIPGQYLRMYLPHEDADDRGTTRYFTIASSPHEKEFVMFTIKIYDSSFKKTLHNLKPGDLVQFFGPMGWFLLPKHEKKEKVFLAGGIGVTPFHSLLTSLVDTSLSHPMTLFASFAKQEDVIFHKALHGVSKKNKDIRVVYTVTQDLENGDWQGEKGRVSKKMLEKYVGDLSKAVFYIVGSPAMVAGMRSLLLDIGVPAENIDVEDFTGY
ncbi:MAG TPA: FAD-dependent oxidoreductase [Patescibacteria group bacterium]|nr:FAD-dependent oxidoreductase [Patescibacteria group bacterium]